MAANIHQGQPVLVAGTTLDAARAAMIMIHGRGASAMDILSLSSSLRGDSFAFMAPEASGNTWYPYRFLEPVERNEPYLSSALAAVGDVLAHVNQAGIPTERIIVLGFSQGACLALEYTARNPQRYGGVAALSGGLIGDTLRTYTGSLAETPVLLGCSDVDFHIPVERVHASAEVMRGLGATVEERIYPGMGHTVNDDELGFVQTMMDALVG